MAPQCNIWMTSFPWTHILLYWNTLLWLHFFVVKLHRWSSVPILFSFMLPGKQVVGRSYWATCAQHITNLSSPVPGSGLFTCTVDDPWKLHFPACSSWAYELWHSWSHWSCWHSDLILCLQTSPAQSLLAPTCACSALWVYPHIRQALVRR